MAFAALDARYLNAELRARGVYDAVADDNSVVPLSLKGLATEARPGRWWWPNRFRSWSILYFYGLLAVVGGALLILALFAGPEDEPAAPKSPGKTPVNSPSRRDCRRTTVVGERDGIGSSQGQ